MRRLSRRRRPRPRPALRSRARVRVQMHLQVPRHRRPDLPFRQRCRKKLETSCGGCCTHARRRVGAGRPLATCRRGRRGRWCSRRRRANSFLVHPGAGVGDMQGTQTLEASLSLVSTPIFFNETFSCNSNSSRYRRTSY